MYSKSPRKAPEGWGFVSSFLAAVPPLVATEDLPLAGPLAVLRPFSVLPRPAAATATVLAYCSTISGFSVLATTFSSTSAMGTSGKFSKYSSGTDSNFASYSDKIYSISSSFSSTSWSFVSDTCEKLQSDKLNQSMFLRIQELSCVNDKVIDKCGCLLELDRFVA